jgi:hypothetical protein
MTDSASWQKLFGGNALVFAESMCIRRFEGQFVARPEGAQPVAGGWREKIFWGTCKLLPT